jgi:ribose transport system permease protein
LIERQELLAGDHATKAMGMAKGELEVGGEGVEGPATAALSLSPASLRAILSGVMPAVVLVALILVVGFFAPSFLSLYSFGVLLGESTIILLLAIPQTMVIMIGGIDLSIASIASLASILLALLLPEIGFWAIPAVLVACMAIGATQGYIHVVAQVPSFVVTLAGLGLWSGIALAIAHTTISVDEGYDAVGWLQATVLGIPIAFFGGLALLLALVLVFRRMSIGRYVLAIGLGETAALLSGIRVGRVKILIFTLSGLFAGIAGVAMVARSYAGNPSGADKLLLPSIAAVVIGGTAITGGFGGLGRTLIGVLTVTVLRVGIAIVGIDPGYEPLAYGLVIIGAVALTMDRARISVVK